MASRALFRRGLLIGVICGVLSACGYTFDAILPPGIPVDEGWQSLPVSDLLSRETMTLRALAFCRRAECGEDSVLGVFTASGEEAERLERSLATPSELQRRIEEAEPLQPRPNGRQANDERPPVNVVTERVDLAGWTGVAIDMSGGIKARKAAGVVFSRRRGNHLEIVVAISSDRASAEGLARSAAD